MYTFQIHDDLQKNLAERSDTVSGKWGLFLLAYQAELESLSHTFDDLSCLRILPGILPYPHQIASAKRVINDLHGRALLADEVGLGKTIEAGLILKEYMVRGLVKKALVLVPASLVLQWTRELNEKFALGAFAQRNEWSWTSYDVVVASMDTTKREPHRTLVLSQHYDLVIVDEAHKLKNNRTRNWQLVNQLKKKYLLLVTATPVQNNLKEVYNLIHLLRPGQLGTLSTFTNEHVMADRTPKNPQALRSTLGNLMVRNRKKDHHLDFTERHVQAILLDLSKEEMNLYQAVSEFIKDEYQNRTKAHRSLLPLITLQREICSSSYAALPTLEKLMASPHLAPDRLKRLEEIYELAKLVPGYTKINQTIELAKSIADKLIIFTEYRATQDFLLYMLQRSGIKAVPFRGGFRRGKKDWMKDLFEHRAQILVATEAGGEGINLQFCNQVINFDLPWNPMRVEQRIGRVHRLGQTRPVYIYNLATKATIEEHMVHLLQEKIHMFEAVIGELDVILGGKAFEKDLLQAFVESKNQEEVRARLNVLSKRVTHTHETASQVKE